MFEKTSLTTSRMRFVLAAVLALFSFFNLVPDSRAEGEPTVIKAFAGCKALRPGDGRYGFVWKPSGAHTAMAVLVLPEPFVLNTTSVDLFTPAGRRIEGLYMKSTGVCIPGLECLKRPTFRGLKTGLGYKRKVGSLVIRAKTKTKNCYTYAIKDPSRRYD